MEFNKENSISEIVDFLKQNHYFKYQTLNLNDEIRILKKSNGFGSYLHIVQKGQILESLKINGGGENLIVMDIKLKEALESLGFFVIYSESSFKD